MDAITRFRGQYHFLSNFWPAPVRSAHSDIVYPTAEHAYVASKTADWDLRRQIAGLASPAIAKRFGRTIVLRPNWHRLKLPCMRAAVDGKFRQNPLLAEMLCGTGDAELVEGNDWNDTYWGVCRGKGDNHLGLILMEVRKKLSA